VSAQSAAGNETQGAYLLVARANDLALH